MNQLVEIRTNIVYTKENDNYKKLQELIFLIEKPSYKFTNEQEVIRTRELTELRFTVTEKAFDQMLSLLTHLKDINEEDLA